MNWARGTALGACVTGLTLTLGITTFTAPAHSAEPSSNGNGADTKQEGGSDKNGIYAAAQITYSGSVAKNGGTGNMTPTDVNWT
ncbi:hypothetical protein ACWD3K_10375, partial [Streptomyces sp. NPDC002778]